jgi:hypothetical protein
MNNKGASKVNNKNELKDYKNFIIKAWSITNSGTWCGLDFDSLLASRDTLKMSLKLVDKFTFNKSGVSKADLIESAHEALVVINNYLSVYVFDDPDKDKNTDDNPSKEVERIVYRYIKTDADLIAESERKRKSHYNDLVAERNKNQLLTDIIRSLKKEVKEVKSENKIFRKDLKKSNDSLLKFKDALRGIS